MCDESYSVYVSEIAQKHTGGGFQMSCPLKVVQMPNLSQREKKVLSIIIGMVSMFSISAGQRETYIWFLSIYVYVLNGPSYPFQDTSKKNKSAP